MILSKEIDMIGDGRLREAARLCIKDRKEMLEIYPSSLGGKYHPPDERRSGGLVKHIKRMVYLLHEASPHFGLSQLEHDILIYCALTHDVSNIDISEVVDGEIVRDKKKYVKWHADMSSQIASTYLTKTSCTLGILDDIVLTIQGIIQSHMGAWYPGNRQPSTKLEIVFSLADFIVSRENVLVEVE